MRGSYLLLRGETFHLRMRVPASLVPAIGCSELKLSLYENRKRDAQLKASFLAFHVRAFFADLRQAMKSLSRTEVIQLVDSWRRKMIDRDSLLRRQVEAGMSPLSLQVYGESCETTGDVFTELANQVLPPAYGDTEDVQLKGRPLESARARAVEMASSVPSDPATDDWLPLATRKELDALSELARRDLLQTWLPVAARLYYEKAAASSAPGLILSPEAASGSLPTPVSPANCPASEAPSQAVSTDLQGPTLGEAWALYLEHQSTREEAWRGSVPDSARLAWDDFSGLLGEHIPLASIDRAICKRYEAFANKRPKRALPEFRDLSPDQIESQEVPVKDRLSRTGVAEGLNRITSFFKWCVREHLIDRNPAEGLQSFIGEDTDSEDDEVQPWTLDEVQALLSPKDLRAFIESHRHARGASAAQRWTYFPWLVVFGLYTGARLNELGGLLVSDVIRQHDHSEGSTPVLSISPNQLRRLKTAQAKRTIPIHPDLVALGLWDLVQHRHSEIQADLLLWAPGRGDKVAGKATDDFKEYTQKLGLYQPRVKVFHSFRHTFKTLARGVMDSGALNSIVGHRADDSTGGTYEHALHVPRHKHLEQLSQINFGLDLDGLSSLLRECRSLTPRTNPFGDRAT